MTLWSWLNLNTVVADDLVPFWHWAIHKHHTEFLKWKLKLRWGFNWIFFPRVQLTIFQHLFRKWLGAGQATIYYLNQWWLVYWRIYASLRLNEQTISLRWIGHNIHWGLTRITGRHLAKWPPLLCLASRRYRDIMWCHMASSVLVNFGSVNGLLRGGTQYLDQCWLIAK